MNYTPLRFCGALAGALAVQRTYSNGTSLLAFLCIAAASSVLLLAISPEQAITFILGTLIFFVICVRNRRPGTLAALLGFVLFSGILLAFAYRSHILDSVIAFGGGVLNIPILPSPQSIILLTFLVTAGCVAISAFRRNDSHHPLLYLICLSLVSLPAALGRADLGHIIINTMGALIAVMVVLSQYRTAWRLTWPAFAFAVCLLWVIHAHQYRAMVKTALTSMATWDDSPALMAASSTQLTRLSASSEKARSAIAEIYAWRARRATSTLPHLASHASLFAPFGFPFQVNALPGDPMIVTGKYFGLFPLTSDLQVQEKIVELERYRNGPLILPLEFDCSEDANGIRQTVKELLLASYTPPIRNAPPTAGRRFCAFIQANYAASAIVAPIPGWKIWLRK